jgi:hypothetical protein
LTTFSKTLAARLSQNADLLLGSDVLERARIDIVHLHKLAQNPWVNTLKCKFAFIKARQFNELPQAAIAKQGQGVTSHRVWLYHLPIDISFL